LPFRPGIFDGAAMIRVIHHMSDAPRVLSQVRRSLAPKGVFILEHANKRNLKAMIRYALKKQTWNPYDHEPVEFVELNFDFHPAYICEQLETAQFEIAKRLPVSFFRLNLLKNNLPVNWLVGFDRLLQGLPFFYTPSIFVKSIAIGETADNTELREVDRLFVCPEYGTPLKREGDLMINPQQGLRYAIRDGIYDFKAPLD
jgi:SAM-dependent methyltransferase